MEEAETLSRELADAVGRALTEPAIEAICRERMKGIQSRLETALEERDAAIARAEQTIAAYDLEAAKDKAVRGEVRKGVANAKAKAKAERERAETERKRANRYQRRAYEAEGKLKQIFDDGLDPYEVVSGGANPEPDAH